MTSKHKSIEDKRYQELDREFNGRWGVMMRVLIETRDELAEAYDNVRKLVQERDALHLALDLTRKELQVAKSMISAAEAAREKASVIEPSSISDEERQLLTHEDLYSLDDLDDNLFYKSTKKFGW